MYIGSVDQTGLHHLLLEIVSNSIDEFLNNHGDEVRINISKDLKTASVIDNGRGIPFGKTEKGTEAIIDIATSLHSGGKFGQEGYSVSGGLHGIGLTAVNALSSNFEIQSVREGKVAHLTSVRGRDAKLVVNDNAAKLPRGTKITFTPDSNVFGNSKFDINKIEEMIKELSFLTSGMKFYVNGKLFLSKEGLKDMVRYKAEDPLTKISYISGEIEGYQVEVAFQFTERRTERIYAYTNNIPNREGGTHVTGFRTSFTNAMNRLARKYGKLEDKDANLSGDMLRSGLLAVVSIKMQEAPVFQGQTKEKLMTAGARGAVGQIINPLIDDSLTKEDALTIIERAIIEQKAEAAAKRAREAAQKVAAGGRNMNALKDLPAKLTDCSSRNGEIWLLEGDSAAGNAKMCRDPKTQAILPLRGKVLNTHDKELADILENKEVKEMITAFGSGIHNQFNIHNLRYNKIVLLSDADSDGKHINLLLLTLFLKHLPELVKQGKIFVAIPPLYKVTKGKKVDFYYSNEELEAAKIDGEVTRFKGIGEMNADELWDTTMNPETRKLAKVQFEDFDEALKLFDTLMGKSSAARREFIISNDLVGSGDDFFGDDANE